MSINQWRYARYTDDGCAIYQCLKCYGEWEARSSPGYMNEGGEYHATWHFCPLCGTKWEKMRTTDSEWFTDQQIGPRRMRIEKATDEYYRARSRCGEADPPFWYVLEEKMHWACRSPDEAEWKPACRMAGMQVSAVEALEYKWHYIDQNRERTELREDNGEDYRLVFHFRLVVVKSEEAKRRYAHAWTHLNQHRIYHRSV